MINIKTILAPTDFSTHAEHALKYAGELARNLKAKMHVLHVAEYSNVGGDPDASELLIHAKERGVLFAPGRYFYVQSPLPNTLRLGFASLDEKQIARGVATLAELLKIEMRKRQRGVRRAERSRVALV